MQANNFQVHESRDSFDCVKSKVFCCCCCCSDSAPFPVPKKKAVESSEKAKISRWKSIYMKNHPNAIAIWCGHFHGVLPLRSAPPSTTNHKFKSYTFWWFGPFLFTFFLFPLASLTFNFQVENSTTPTICASSFQCSQCSRCESHKMTLKTTLKHYSTVVATGILSPPSSFRPFQWRSKIKVFLILSLGAWNASTVWVCVFKCSGCIAKKIVCN